MTTKYLLSSAGIHISIAAALSSLVLLLPPSKAPVAKVEVLEFQKVSGGVQAAVAPTATLPRIVVKACRDAARPKGSKTSCVPASRS